MRHRGGADFAFTQLLLEEVHGDVAPDVAVEVDEDRVGAFDLVEELGHVVMRLDLDRVRVERHAEAFLDDFAGVGFPVVFRIGDEVGVVVADGAVHLGVDLDGTDGFDHAFKTHGDVGEFLADRRRRGGLAVRAGEHRDFGPLVGEACDRVVDLLEVVGEGFAAALEHDGVARVVDVLGRAREVHKLGGGLELFVVGDLVLDPVLDGLHVMVRRLFDFLDGFAVGEREVVGEAAQEGLAVVAEVRKFSKAGFGKTDEPLHFDTNAGVHEGAFGEDVAKRVGLAGIAAVDRGEGGKGIQFHGGKPRVKKEKTASAAQEGPQGAAGGTDKRQSFHFSSPFRVRLPDGPSSARGHRAGKSVLSRRVPAG